VNEKKGRKGEKRKEKRQTELGILQLFEKEGQEWIKAKKEGREKVVGGIEKNVKKTEKLMAEVDAPFSHVAPVQRPPPYEKEVELGELYPQLPVISQEGNYLLRDEDEQVIEMGKAETTIKMYPSTKKGYQKKVIMKSRLDRDPDVLIGSRNLKVDKWVDWRAPTKRHGEEALHLHNVKMCIRTRGTTTMNVSHEVNLLVEEIQRLGSKNADGKTTVKLECCLTMTAVPISSSAGRHPEGRQEEEDDRLPGRVASAGVHDNVDIILLQE
ncbi:hypothetical protein INR49_026304, partial [Caranx melampygus]